MKNTIKLGFVFVLLISMLAVACSKEEAPTKDESKTETNKEVKEEVKEEVEEDVDDLKEEVEEETGDMSELMKERAKIENISVKELEKVLDGLAELSGEKYGVSKEEYIDQVNANGSTILEEWIQVSDVMGLSIQELYDAEKLSMESRTDEEKEILAGMSDALSEIGDINLGEIPNEETINALVGITENTSGEIRVVEGEFKEDFYYKADDISFEYKDDYSLTVEYYSDEEIEEILVYYVSLLENTKDYLLISQTGIDGGMIQAFYNEMIVYVEIDVLEGRTHVSAYLDMTSLE